MDMRSGLSRALKDAARKGRVVNASSFRKSKASPSSKAVAQWHYDRACEAYDVYQHCLDDRGLLHPDFITPMRQAMQEFRRHVQIGDNLMRAA